MRKSLIVVASALLFGVGAADVSNPRLDYGDDVIAGLVSPEDLRPRAARQNYPACRPGRGDDRCIQLYERGVRERLARWDRRTGGWNGEVRTARAERRRDWRARQRHRRAHSAQHQRRGHQRAAIHRERRVEHARPSHHRVANRGGHDVRQLRRNGLRELPPREVIIDRRVPERVHGERTGTPGI